MASVEALRKKAEEAEARLIESANEKDAYLVKFKVGHAKLQEKFDAAWATYLAAREETKTDEQRALDQVIGTGE